MPKLTAPELTAVLQRVLSHARAELMPLPQTPGIELFLLNEDFPQHALSRDEMMAVIAEPAYWAFCWASGQVLAEYLLRNPHWVEGKRVLDFGSGSGVVAIAAALAGAKKVYACDIDPDAVLATRCNVRHNRVDVEVYQDVNDIDQPIDLIIVADVLYDRENLPWLSRFLELAREVLVADSRIKDFCYPGYSLLTVIEGTTVPDLDEFDEFKQVRLYRGLRQGKEN